MLLPRRTMPTILTSLLLVTCWLLSPANAGVLLDNTTQGSATLDTTGYSVGFNGGTFRGVQFTSSSNIELTSMSLGLSVIGSPSNTVDAKLYHVDGASITEINSKDIDISDLDNYYPKFKAIDLTGFSLEAGKTYRLGLSLTSTSAYEWLEWVKTTSPTLPTGTSGLTFDSYKSFISGNWSTGGTNASFYLQGTPSGASVPEPSAIALAVIGAGSMVTRRLLLRRRRKS